jgi:hypothetical protein
MYVAPRDWNSFWDLATPAEAAAMLRESYGAGAAEAALECASKAKEDDRETDHFFWLAVSAELKKDPCAATSGPQPAAH